MDSNAVTDSTDWLDTPLPDLAPLESSLRCQVCKEVFTTPMITSCSHTFCSLCIRRYLSQEGKCPSCREPDQEMKLRHNWAVEELAGIWNEHRAKIFDFAKRSAEAESREEITEERPKKRRKVDEKPIVVQKSGLEERRSTRSQSRRAASQASQSVQSVPSTQEEIPDSDAGSAYAESPKIDSRQFQAAEPNDGLVGCPNCTRRIKEALINTHLDKCLQGLAGSPSPPPAQARTQSNAPAQSGANPPGKIAYNTTKPNGSTIQKLPTINYSLLNDNALRKKLKELGIPNQGSKEVMKKRHIEWVNLYNANSDSLHPISKMKLLQKLDVWERNFTRDERSRQQADGSGSGMMAKDFDREGYMRKEREPFDDLIKKARAGHKVKPAATPDDATSDAVPAGAQADINTQPERRLSESGNDAENSDHVSNTSQHPQYTETGAIMTNGHRPKDQEEASRVNSHISNNTLVPDTPPRQTQPSPMKKSAMFVDHYGPGAGVVAASAVNGTETIDLVTPEKKTQY